MLPLNAAVSVVASEDSQLQAGFTHSGTVVLLRTKVVMQLSCHTYHCWHVVSLH